MTRKIGNFGLKLNFKRMLIKSLPFILLVALYIVATSLGIATAPRGGGMYVD